MKYIKVETGIYKSDNGYTIQKFIPYNTFTGRPMSSRETIWHIYNSANEKIDFALTLKEAKAIIERL